eukprot:scaffold155393_cov25-Tisochrysis_lutea.AAC.3
MVPSRDAFSSSPYSLRFTAQCMAPGLVCSAPSNVLLPRNCSPPAVVSMPDALSPGTTPSIRFCPRRWFPSARVPCCSTLCARLLRLSRPLFLASRMMCRWSLVFWAWQARQSAWRLAIPSCPPRASGTTWSTSKVGGNSTRQPAQRYSCRYATVFLSRSPSALRRGGGAARAPPALDWRAAAPLPSPCPPSPLGRPPSPLSPLSPPPPPPLSPPPPSPALGAAWASGHARERVRAAAAHPLRAAVPRHSAGEGKSSR